MQNTVNLNLKKPDQNDFVNIGDINDNMDILDAEVAKKYVKPLAGIPSLDLDSATQAALKKAETALQSVTKASVGLGNVDNTSDVNKPVSTAQKAALDKKANLASPSLTGTPTAPTAAESTNTQQIATTAFVDRAVKTHQADLVSHGIYGVATGTNALVMTDSKVTSYVDGMLVAFKNTTASTGATTLNINALGAKAIVKANGTAVNNLKANAIYQLRYNGVNFTLLGEGGEYGNVTASDVREGVTFGTENGVQVGELLVNNYRLVASDNTFLESKVTTPRVVKSTQYTKITEATMNINGAVRVTFDIGTQDYRYPVYGRVYKNGNAAGIERISTSSPGTIAFTEDFTVAIGDKVQIYIKCENPSYESRNTSFILKGSVTNLATLT